MEATQKATKPKFTLPTDVEINSVTSGQRVSNDTNPTLETCSQLNKFKLNRLASELMQLLPGGRVKLFTTGMKTMDGKYLIAVASEEDESSAKVLSPTKAKGFGALLFNYSGIHSRMAQNTVNAVEMGAAAIIEAGLGVERNSGCFFKHKIVFELVELEQFNEDAPFVDKATGNEFTKVYALINPVKEDVDVTKESAPRKKKAVLSNNDTVNTEVDVEGDDVSELED